MTAPLVRCPGCLTVNGNLASVNALRPPQPGDIAVCFGCKEAYVLDVIFGVVTMRYPSEDEAVQMDADPVVQRTLLAMTLPAATEAIRAARALPKEDPS